jgi:hypothetical protein
MTPTSSISSFNGCMTRILPSPSFWTKNSCNYIARLFEFAQRLLIRKLKAMSFGNSSAYDPKNHVPPISVVEFVFENLPDDPPLRKLLVAWYTWHRDSARALALDSSLNLLPFLSLPWFNRDMKVPKIHFRTTRMYSMSRPTDPGMQCVKGTNEAICGPVRGLVIG